MSTVVLVVEDDSDVTDLLRLILVQKGFAPTIANNGHDALKLLASVQPAIIFSDVMMPGMSGAEFCSVVREHPAYTDTPMIVTSAQDEEAVRREFNCYDAFVPKPYEPDDLLDLMRKLLSDKVKPGARPRSSKPFAFSKIALEFLDSPRT